MLGVLGSPLPMHPVSCIIFPPHKVGSVPIIRGVWLDRSLPQDLGMPSPVMLPTTHSACSVAFRVPLPARHTLMYIRALRPRCVIRTECSARLNLLKPAAILCFDV